MTLPRLSILVPYRDRKDHLARFLPHMTVYFQRDKLDKEVPYRITIVEQAPGKAFNPGKLCNAGFLLTEDACDYVCFHDVDYLPIWADYRMPDRPTRVVWYGADAVEAGEGSNFVVRHRHEDFFGAVVMFPTGDFRRVNGYSNDYWGWGYHDNDLRNRCLAEGLEIGLHDGTFNTLPHRHRGFVTVGVPSEENRRNRSLYEARWPAPPADRRYREDGLGNAQFKVLGRSPLAAADGKPFPNAERVLVEI